MIKCSQKTLKISGLIFTLLILCLSHLAWATVNPDIDKAQNKLDKYTKNLNYVNQQLERKQLSEHDLEYLYALSESALDGAKVIKSDAKQQENEQQATLDAMGPAPTKDEPAEDKATNERRQQLQTTTAAYAGLVNQANAAITQARNLFEEIAAAKIQTKAKILLNRQIALLEPEVWRQAWAERSAVKTALAQSLQVKAKSKPKANSSNSSNNLQLYVFIFMALLLFYPIPYWLNRRFNKSQFKASPTIINICQLFLIEWFTVALIPMAALWLFTYSLWQLKTYTDVFWTGAQLILLTLCGILSACVLLRCILSPKHPVISKSSFSETQANIILKRAYPLVIILGVGWFLLQSQHILTAAPYLLAETVLLLHLILTISTIALCRHKIWQTQNKQLRYPKLIKSCRYLSIVIVAGTLLVRLLGYTILANTILISYIQTLLILFAVLLLHYLSKSLLAYFLGISGPGLPWLNQVMQLEQRGRDIIHYWLMMLINLIIFPLAIAAMLLAWGIEPRYLRNILEPLIFGFRVGNAHLSLISFFCALAVFLVLFALTRFVQRIIQERIFPYTRLDHGAQHAIKTGIGYLGIALTIIAAISVLGIKLESLAIILGALSVGIGFGLQQIVSNFISGIIMLIERPIKIGDWIVVGQDEGVVKRISVRATEIETFEGTAILIPNSQLITGTVHNWMLHRRASRIEVVINVAYGSDTEQVKSLLLTCANEHNGVLKNPEPYVLFSDFGDSRLQFKLRCYIADVDDRLGIPSELRYAIDNQLKASGLDTPYPHLMVNITS